MEELERRFNLTNYEDHPTNEAYTVFKFFREDEAKHFTDLLNKNKVKFESDKEVMTDKTVYLFGIRKSDLKRVLRLNNLTVGTHREPFVKNQFARWAIVIIGGAIITMAIIGAIMNSK